MAGFVQHDRHTAALEPTATPILALKENDRDFLGDELVKNFNDLKTCSPLVRYIVNPVLFNIRAILNDIYSNHRVHFEKVQRLASLIIMRLYQLIHPFEDTEFVQVPNTQLLNMVLHLDSKVMKIRVDIKACQRITASSKLALWYRNRTMRRIIRKATADVKNKKYLDEVKVFCERYDKNVFQSAAALQSPAEPIAQERERQEEERLTRLIIKILDEREKQKANQSISGDTAPAQSASAPTSPTSTSVGAAVPAASAPASSISSAMPLPTVLASAETAAPGTTAPASLPTISASTSSAPDPQA